MDIVHKVATFSEPAIGEYGWRAPRRETDTPTIGGAPGRAGMGGPSAAESHSLPRRDMHRRGGGGTLAADLPRRRTERDPGAGMRDAATGAGRRGTLGAAQQRWPEYNRIVIWVTAAAGTAITAAAVVAEAIAR